MDWDSAAEAGIGMDVGASDTVVADLSQAERAELQRLLREAMAPTGARAHEDDVQSNAIHGRDGGRRRCADGRAARALTRRKDAIVSRQLRAPPAEDSVSPAEIQRLFDAYVVMQAQKELELSDDQFPRFLARVRTLQEVRRRGQMQRGRMLQELRRLVAGDR